MYTDYSIMYNNKFVVNVMAEDFKLSLTRTNKGQIT